MALLNILSANAGSRSKILHRDEAAFAIRHEGALDAHHARGLVGLLAVERLTLQDGILSGGGPPRGGPPLVYTAREDPPQPYPPGGYPADRRGTLQECQK